MPAYTEFQTGAPIRLEDYELEFPALWNREKLPGLSERYTTACTHDAVKALQTEGFEPYIVRHPATNWTRRQSVPIEFRDHQVVLRKNADAAVNGLQTQVVLTNGGDGKTSLRLDLGVWRKVCDNGMVYPVHGTIMSAIHSGADPGGRVVEGLRQTLALEGRMKENIDRMREVFLAPSQQLQLARTAADLRFGPEKGPKRVNDLLAVRRPADEGDDLWTVFNRLQEALTGLDLSYGGAGIRKRKIRKVVSPKTVVRLNKALWAAATDWLPA